MPYTGTSAVNRELRVPAVDHAPCREPLERASLHKLTAALRDLVKVDVGREVVVVGATGSRTHGRPLGVARLEHLDQAIDSAFWPADTEGLPLGPDRWDPLVRDDHGHRAGGERLVEPHRRRGIAPGAQHKAGACQYGPESRSSLIEAFRRRIPESEPMDLLYDRVWVLEREQRAATRRGVRSDKREQEIRRLIQSD